MFQNPRKSYLWSILQTEEAYRRNSAEIIATWVFTNQSRNTLLYLISAATVFIIKRIQCNRKKLKFTFSLASHQLIFLNLVWFFCSPWLRYYDMVLHVLGSMFLSSIHTGIKTKWNKTIRMWELLCVTQEFFNTGHYEVFYICFKISLNWYLIYRLIWRDCHLGV